ncbi:MAG TPA: TraR/DksA C4-type zinc finger protein [Candidatus Paceibacterota bacterium]
MDTAKHRAALEAEKVRLEGELSTVGKPSPANPTDWNAASDEDGSEPSDLADNADRMESLETNEAIATQLEVELAEVVAALGRIEGGTYGSCEVCHKPIEADRLEANPAAKTCKAHLNE